MKNNYTDKQIETILKSAIVLIDTREKENTHIIEWFEKKKINYKSKKLNFGDYTLMIPKNEELGIEFDKRIDYAIERKGSLEEISGNLTQGRTAFENELVRGKGKMTILIENGSYNKIITHAYRTEYNEKSFLASLITFYHRYDIKHVFVEKCDSAPILYKHLIYKLKEDLK